MNEYEMKQEARRQRYLDRAAKADRDSDAQAAQGSAMFDAIPFGQPILTDHYSAKRDRAYRERASAHIGKSVALREKAGYWRGKAESIDYAGVSSDDPDAADKLRATLAELEAKQKRMKEANRIIQAARRKSAPAAQTIAALVAIGFTEAVATARVSPDPMGDVGFPRYALSNNSANIRRYRLRLAALAKQADRTTTTTAGNGYRLRYDKDENRVMFEFQGRPDEATRAILKHEGFHWSPSRTAWVRQWTRNAEFAATRVQAAIANA